LSSKTLIKSCLSPDGEYLLSGSESGKPFLWNVYTGKTYLQDIDDLQIDFKGPVTDVAWNTNYHMIALCGFGDEFPILIYCWEHKHEQLQEVDAFSDVTKSIRDDSKIGSDSSYLKPNSEESG